MLVIVPFLFSSCIDYVQSITYSDGMYHIYGKMTVNKTIIELTDNDPEELISDDDLPAADEIPVGAMARKVDTDFDIGYEFSFEVNPKDRNRDGKEVLPTVSGNKCYIPIIMSDSMTKEESFSEMDESDGMYMMFLAQAKCRILIDKNVIPSFSAAYLEGRNGVADYEIPVYDYGNEWCAEIPVITIYTGTGLRTDRIVIEKCI